MPEALTAGPLLGHRTVTAAAVATFGSLTGDYSRIHFDHQLGEASPLGRGFAHGLLSACWALGAMTLHAPQRLGCGEPGAVLAEFRVRFHEPVLFDDTLATRCRATRSDGPSDGWEERRSEFAVLNQHGRTTTSGATLVRVRDPNASLPLAPDTPNATHGEPLWPDTSSARPPAERAPWAAEDVVADGPRGATAVRTLTEADVVNYTNFTGELNPAYSSSVFAEQALFGARVVPPMLCFCLGFSVWLRQLLALPLGGGESDAGHLGDRWQFIAPVHVGDTLEVRYQPLSLRRTRSQPTRGVATFGLQLVNQHSAVVQQGEVDMMLAMRDVPSEANEQESEEAPNDHK